MDISNQQNHRPLLLSSFGLVTDLYQLVQANALFNAGKIDLTTSFGLFFRKSSYPFTISCGIAILKEILSAKPFSEEDLEFLSSMISEGTLTSEFISYLKSYEKWPLEVWAVPEGELVFAHEPIMRVEGAMIWCLLFETVALNIVNAQIPVATMAAKMRLSIKKHQKIVELGLRRSPEISGIFTSRAAFVGGLDGTSNVAAAKEFAIPLFASMSHAYIQSYGGQLGESQAFSDFILNAPINCSLSLLVDTYNAEIGIEKAVSVLKNPPCSLQGRVVGVRIDSGDLLSLARLAKIKLLQAGLTSAKVTVSGDLDPEKIATLAAEECIDTFGVGTALSCAAGANPLGAVFKLKSVLELCCPDQNLLDQQTCSWQWIGRIKLSNTPGKVSFPGRHRILREFDQNGYLFDTIIDESELQDRFQKLSLDSLAEAQGNTASFIVDQKNYSYSNPNDCVPTLSLVDARAKTLESILKFPTRVPYPALYSQQIKESAHKLGWRIESNSEWS